MKRSKGASTVDTISIEEEPSHKRPSPATSPLPPHRLGLEPLPSVAPALFVGNDDEVL